MRINPMMEYARLGINFMRTNVIMRYATLIAGLILSMIWGFAWFRYISLPTFMIFLIILFTRNLHKNRKITYVALGFYLFTTVIPIDIRTTNFEYEVPMPTVKIVPLEMGYPLDYYVERAFAGEVYLGDDYSTGLEPKWVLLWRTDFVSLDMNNVFDFLYKIGYIKI